jgi:hypothetical protein
MALDELAGACHEARALAGVLEYAADLLCGRPTDPEEGSPQDIFTAAGRLRHALGRLERARQAAREAWNALTPEDKEEVPSPEELLDVS